jgi:hypothetical protein
MTWRAAGLPEGPLQQSGNWYERPWMAPAPTDRLPVVAGESTSACDHSGQGHPGANAGWAGAYRTG